MFLTRFVTAARARKSVLTRTAAIVAASALVLGASLAGSSMATAAAPNTAVLTITKSTGATTVVPGDIFVYELEVGCSSLETICIDAELNDAVPADFTVNDVRVVGTNQNATVTTGAYNATTGTPVNVKFNETSTRFPGIKGIEDGQKVSVLITAQLPLLGVPLSKDGVQVVNTGSVSASNADTKTDTATVTLSVPPSTGVTVTKKWEKATQIADHVATNDLTVTIQNTSNINASTMTLVEPKTGTDNPFDYVAFTGFGAFTMPAGAVSVATTAFAGTTPYVGGALTTPTLPAGIDAEDVTGFSFTFASGTGEKILANGAQGSILMHTVQRATVSTSATTVVKNTVFGSVTTPRATATAEDSKYFTINPLTAAVTAAKSFTQTGTLFPGDSSTATITGANNSNYTLSTLKLSEPDAALSPNPFAANLDFIGFGAAGTNTVPATAWPSGATGATLVYNYAGGSSDSFALAAGATAWHAPDAAKRVVGFTVTYTGTIAKSAAAVIPFYTTTATTATANILNRVKVEGSGPGGTATPATAEATLKVAAPSIVTTIGKTLSSGTNIAGQEILATLTGKVSSSSNVPVHQLVIEDSSAGTAASMGSKTNFWSAFTAARVASTIVPANMTLTIKTTTDGTTYTTLGSPYPATTNVDLALPAGTKGVRFIYDATLTNAIPTETNIVAKLVFTLDSAQSATNIVNCASSTIAGASNTTGSAAAPCQTVILNNGTAPTPVLSQTTTKSWTNTQLLIPNDVTNGTYPTSVLSIATKNSSSVNATKMTLQDATGGTTPFEYVDVTKINSINTPAGTVPAQTKVELLAKDGSAVYSATGATAISGIPTTGLGAVYDIRVSIEGVFAKNAELKIQVATQLRKTTRTDGTAITAAANLLPTIVVPANPNAGTYEHAFNNTVTGVVSNASDTITATASAPVTIIPAAASALKAALTKTFTPTSDTVYSKDANRVVKLALGVNQTAGNPNVYVLEDTTPTFWNAFDFKGLTKLTGTTSSPNANYYVQIDYLVSRTFTTNSGAVVTGAGQWKTGAETLMPSGTSGPSAAQKDLPAGVTADQISGIRITYTAKNGAVWGNTAIDGFNGQQATFEVVPRHYLRTGEPTSDSASAQSNPGESIKGRVSNEVTGTVDDGLRPSPVTITEATAVFDFVGGNQATTISKTPKNSAVVPGEEIPFKLFVENTGTKPLVNPVFTDIIPWDAKGALLQYNPIQYTAASYKKEPATASITDVPGQITVTTTDVVVAGKQTTQIAFSFPAGSSILPGEKYTITVPMKVRAGVERNTIFDNTFTLTADGPYSATYTAQVTVLEGGSYGRIKDVKENVTAPATATGLYHTIDKTNVCINDGGFYRVPCLVETKPGSTETWRLRVINTGNLPTNTMTMVDVFPKPGDTGTSKELSALSRGSLWSPIFQGDLEYGALPAGTVTTLWYQTAAQTPCVLNGDADGADPFGTTCASSQWLASSTQDLSEIADPSKVTAIKVQFDFPTTKLQPGEMVGMTYQTKTPAKLPNGVPAYIAGGAPTPAWNSFVVFTTTDKTGGLDYDTLEPNKAGIAFATPVAVGDYVWVDANRDGKQDTGELPLAGVKVTLYDSSNAIVGTETTDADGHYLFDELFAGDYHVKFELTSAQQAKYRFTDEGVGTDGALDSNADKSSGVSDVFHLDAADAAYPNVVSDDDYKTATGIQIKALYIDPTIDAGVIPNTVSVGDYVWLDENKDGIQDASEAGIEGVQLSLTGPDGKAVVRADGKTVDPTKTDNDGWYEFADLPVLKTGESYTVSIDYVASAIPLFSLFQSPVKGTLDRALDSSRDSAKSTDLTVDGDSDETLDFGFYFVDLTTFPFDPETLAFTGVRIVPMVIIFGGLMTGGFMLVLLGRRRSSARHL